MKSVRTRIEIIGVNPFVLLPGAVLNSVFASAGKEKGPIPVKGTIDGHSFIQTLVKFSGKWRLYINGQMLKACRKKVGQTITLIVEYDPVERSVPLHPKLEKAFAEHKEAKNIFDKLPPSRRKEILRYIANLKTEESINRNIDRAIAFLLGKERFAGRDKP